MRIPSGNLILMIVSAILAALLWLWVGAQASSEVIISTPLEYRNLPKTFEFSSDGPLLSAINVWVRGNTTIVKNLRPQDISAWIDLAGTTAGARNFELTSNNVHLPYGLSVLRISPSRVHLRIEEVIRRFAPVEPHLEGEPPEGFAVTQMTVVPPQVEVVGPRSAVIAVKNVTTDSIDISSTRGAHTEKVNVGVDNSSVRLGSIKKVTVSLMIAEIKDHITLRRIPVTVEGTKRTIKYNPRVVRIDLEAPKQWLTKISEEQVSVTLDLAGMAPGVYELTPKIIIQDGESRSISVRSVIPERIHVRIQ